MGSARTQNMTGLALDLLLVAALLWSAMQSLTSANLFRGVVLFIIFGLFMTLAWARLKAPDLALTEAVIGAGLTGALLLNGVGQLRAKQRNMRK